MRKSHVSIVPAPPIGVMNLLEIIPNKDKDRNPTEHPDNHIMTLTGTRVPQDVLAHMGTILRQPHTNASGIANSRAKQY